MKSSKYLTSFGFLALLGLMLALAAIAIASMYVMHRNLESIVSQNYVKMTLVWEMRHGARERAMVLHRLLYTSDPFERDDLVLQFSNSGSRFIKARERFQSVDLDSEEKDLLNKALAFASRGQQAQSRVIELFDQGDHAGAEKLVKNEVTEVQDRVTAGLVRLFEYQQRAAERAEQAAGKAYDDARTMIAALTGLFVLVGGGVALYVIRNTSRIEEVLHGEKERAEVTLHSIGDAVITTDRSGRVTYLNPVAEKLTGQTLDRANGAALGTVLNATIEDADTPLFTDFAPGLLTNEAIHPQQAALLTSATGERYAVDLTASAIHDTRGDIIGAVLVMRDVSQANELSRQLNWAASHDALTGLINRREFERRLDAMLQDAHATRRQHALLYLDLDQFKIVNDTCGHMAGDELLRQLSALLEGKIRRSDTLARLGGDEFGVLLEGCPLDKAALMAEDLRDTISTFRFMWTDKPFDIGVSIGLVPMTDAWESTADLMVAADSACYVAKNQGRNRVHQFEPDDQETARHTGEMNWAQRVSQAIRENRFKLFGQRMAPLQPSAAGPAHVEVLLRMLDADGGLVPPMSFIPAAERYGLMPAVDRWVIGAVFDLMLRQGTADDSIYAVNLSGHSLGDDGLLEFVSERLQATGIPPRRLCFEITETAAVSNLRAAAKLIDALRERGCLFALDDFGSGMSSFGYLRQLHVDFLKIDGAFVKDMLVDATDRAMVEAINNIGHVMGLKTIAEFVETAEIAEMLRRLGVDYAQGYGIHVPAAIEA